MRNPGGACTDNYIDAWTRLHAALPERALVNLLQRSEIDVDALRFFHGIMGRAGDTHRHSLRMPNPTPSGPLQVSEKPDSCADP